MRPIILAAAPLAAIVLTPALAADDKAHATPSTSPASQSEPKSDMAEPAEKPSKAPAQTQSKTAATEAKEDKRICRRIRTDASSRRKSKVCLTADQWREVNQGG